MKPSLFPTLVRRVARPLLIAVLAAGGVRAPAQTVPPLISYQGVLRGGNGDLIKSTSKSMWFRVFDAPLNGNQLYAETQLVLLDTNGLFNVVVGSGAQTNNPTKSLLDVFANPAASSQGFFLELQVNESGTSPILPRQQFLTAPFAMAANTAATARSGGDAGGTFTVNGIASIQQLEVLTSAALPAITGPTTLTGKLTVDTIGFPPPIGSSNTPGLALVNSGVAPDMARMIIGDGTGWKFHLGSSNASQGVSDRFTFKDAGFFGVNNPNPTNQLDVIGTASASTVKADNVVVGNSLFLTNSAARLGVGTATAAKGAVEIDVSASVPLSVLYYGSLSTKNNTLHSRDSDTYYHIPAAFIPDLGTDRDPDYPATRTNVTSSVSLYAAGVVRATEFQAFSDARTKRVRGRSSGSEDLATFLGIEVTDYTMVDTVGKDSRPYKKVIAQQVEKVYPQAVSRSMDVVPDIYSRAEAKRGWIPLDNAPTPALKPGDRVQLITDNGKAIHEVVEAGEQGFRIAARIDGPVFVYGREVSDFRNVDYDAISMLNVSATQEMHRMIQAQKAEIGALQTQVQELLAREKEQAARFGALESLVRESQRGLQQASLR